MVGGGQEGRRVDGRAGEWVVRESTREGPRALGVAMRACPVAQRLAPMWGSLWWVPPTPPGESSSRLPAQPCCPPQAVEPSRA